MSDQRLREGKLERESDNCKKFPIHEIPYEFVLWRPRRGKNF